MFESLDPHDPDVPQPNNLTFTLKANKSGSDKNK